MKWLERWNNCAIWLYTKENANKSKILMIISFPDWQKHYSSRDTMKSTAYHRISTWEMASSIILHYEIYQASTVYYFHWLGIFIKLTTLAEAISENIRRRMLQTKALFQVFQFYTVAGPMRQLLAIMKYADRECGIALRYDIRVWKVITGSTKWSWLSSEHACHENESHRRRWWYEIWNNWFRKYILKASFRVYRV